MSSSLPDLVEKLTQDLIDIARHLASIAAILDEGRDQIDLKEVKTKKSKEPRDPDKPKYPKSAYLLYSQDHRSEAKAETNGKASDVMTLLGHRWKALSDEEKQPYRVRAKEAKQQYEKEMELYNNNKKAKLAAGNQNGGSIKDDTMCNDDGDDTSDTESSDSNSSSNQVSEPKAPFQKPTLTTNPSPSQVSEPKAPSQKPTLTTNPSPSQVAEPKVPPKKPIMTSNSSPKQAAEPTVPPKKLTMAKDAVTKKKNIAKQLVKGKLPAKSTGKHLLKNNKRPNSSTSYHPPSKKLKKSKHPKH